MTWLEGAGLVALGFAVGTYGTLVGVGGGFFLVPVLLFMHNPPRIAAGTSLAVVFANAASGTVSFLRQRRVDVRTGTIFAVAGAPGAFLGAYADQHMPHRVFALLFAALLVGVAARLLFGAPVLAGDGTPVVHRSVGRANAARAAAIGLGVGFVASAFGIGGGVIQVPAMVYLFGFPAHIAAATSQFTIACTSLFGAVSHAYFGDVLVTPAALMAAGAIAGAQVGVQLSNRIHADRLLRWLSLAVIFTAIYLVVWQP